MNGVKCIKWSMECNIASWELIKIFDLHPKHLASSKASNQRLYQSLLFIFEFDCEKGQASFAVCLVLRLKTFFMLNSAEHKIYPAHKC